MSFWSPGFWAPGFWSPGFWGEEEDEPGFKPFHIGYGFLPHRKTERAPTLREATAAIFGADWDKDTKTGAIASPRRAAQSVEVSRQARASEERMAEGRQAFLMPPVAPMPLDRDEVKRIIDQARRNAEIASELAAEMAAEKARKTAAALLLLMMEA